MVSMLTSTVILYRSYLCTEHQLLRENLEVHHSDMSC